MAPTTKGMRISDLGNPPPPPQPAYGGGAQGTPPPNYLIWAVLSTMLCFPPLGIPSIFFAVQVNNKWAMGDFMGARDASAKAKKFARWAAITAGTLIVLSLVLSLLQALIIGGSGA